MANNTSNLKNDILGDKKIEFSNSKIKNRIRILENSTDTLIFRTFLDSGGGQTQLHYHSRIKETFKVIQGELNLVIDTNETILIAGNEYSILPYTNHMFYNKSAEEVIFDVEILNPQKMINALQIFYGLNNDGKTNKDGLPTNIFHIAIGLKMMDTFSPKAPYLLQKLGFKTIALLGSVIGIEKKLIAEYCA